MTFNANGIFYNAIDTFCKDMEKNYPKGMLEKLAVAGRRLQIDGQGLSLVLLKVGQEPDWGNGSGMMGRGPVVRVSLDREAMYDDVDAVFSNNLG